MKLNFTKMHGCGNDYIYFNCLEQELQNPSQLSIEMSRRHFSVGADGIVMICASSQADAKMRMFNADGSEGKMCGNAIRCVGKYLYENGIVPKKDITIETLSGIKTLQLETENGKVSKVRVDMGTAELAPEKIPVTASAPVKNYPLTIDGQDYRITCVSMGNPHAVTFVPNVAELPLEKIGPMFETHSLFPERVNTEFVEFISENHLKMRVWERGSGETYACGTGACACAVASILNGYCNYDTTIQVELIGGTLEIECTQDLRVFMTGPAEKVYEGVYEV